MYGFTAFVFDGKKTADKALHTLEDTGSDYPWIDDVAEVSRGKHGQVRIHSTWAQDDDEVTGGLGWGAVTGGLIGALFGPAGAAAGAVAGGEIGALIGASDNVDFDDPKLDEFASSLDKDTSALILVGEGPVQDNFVSAVAPLGGRIIQTSLDETDIKALHKAMKAKK